MTRVCLVGEADTQLRYELLSRETSRRALKNYDLHAPYDNSIGIETVSLGAAVALLNDLNWYIVRFVDEAIVLEPSVSGTEWLSRDLATAIREDAVRPAETGRLLKVYGVEEPEPAGPPPSVETDEDGDHTAEADTDDQLPRLVEPMFLTRTDDEIPEYDIRDVDDTLVVRVTEREFERG